MTGSYNGLFQYRFNPGKLFLQLPQLDAVRIFRQFQLHLLPLAGQLLQFRPRPLDGEPLLVEEALDLEERLHVLAPVHAMLERFFAGESRNSVSQKRRTYGFTFKIRLTSPILK